MIAQRQSQLMLPAFVERIRVRAQRRILWLRYLWESGSPEARYAMAITHDEVDRILADPSAQLDAEHEFYDTYPEAQRLTSEICEIESRLSDEPLLERLRAEFRLTPPEIDLLTLAVAMEIDPQLRRVYGYLNDDAGACHPTPWLAASLFQWPSAKPFDPESALIKWRLARPTDTGANAWSLTTPWVADPFISAFLSRGEISDPMLGQAAALVSCESAPATCLYGAELDSMSAFARAMRLEREQRRAACRQPVALEIELIGPEGAGKRTLAAQFCARFGASLMVADARVLLSAPMEASAAGEQAIRAIRLARIAGAILYWHNADSANPQVWDTLHGYAGETLYGGGAPLAQHKQAGVARKTFHLPPLTRAARTALWRELSDEPAPEPVANWLLMPAEIASAALVAHAGLDAIVEACKKPMAQAAETLFSPLPCPYTWDDIVLPPGLQQHLSELEAQARLRWPVYEEWGFSRLCPMGRGIAALFAGPSGTGKTMAAQVLARSMHMELYRVDLASVMSKYIGETEKNLKQIFDSCERANVLLFFDEADSLFGQRTQVKDAHDRFANIEIDYLLQRMEQFDGIAVLATNRKGDIDVAFLRRIRFIIDFVPPGPAERLALWQRALPRCAPSGEEIVDTLDWPLLAERLNMTGADIKAAALSAAFLAKSDGVKIGMKHIIHAARREMTKHGVAVRIGDLEI